MAQEIFSFPTTNLWTRESFRGFFFVRSCYKNLMVIRSDIFDDVYFSVDDGMAETHHVFLDGNCLPDAWNGRDRGRFIIAETGFGTGLNFLCAWKLFEETAAKGQRLEFISVEKYPLSAAQIRDALAGWHTVLGKYIDRFLALYPLRVPGPHKIHFSDQISLTVWFCDIHHALPEWGMPVDAWFLDGFTPSKNPDMWADGLYHHMARLSHKETTYATFTAAGFVKRGLQDAGFTVEKVKGFGRKRDMMRGRYDGRDMCGARALLPKSVAVVGGGLAGTAMAEAFSRRDIPVTIFEAGETLASGASGGRLGMINPKLTAKPTPQSDYYTAAYAYALRVLQGMKDIDFTVCGSVHLCESEDKDRRFSGYIGNLGWHPDHIVRRGEDLFYPDAACVSPLKLCHVLARKAEVRCNHPVKNLEELASFGHIIVANGFAMRELLGIDDYPVHSVRGQLSFVKPQKDIETNICFGGYITPETAGGYHVMGASFQPWNMSADVSDADHKDNIARYNAAHADEKALGMDDIVGGWAALRSASKDRFPIVGEWAGNVSLSTAHGSHGIISSLMAAEITASRLCGESVPVSQAVLRALSPKRFDK